MVGDKAMLHQYHTIIQVHPGMSQAGGDTGVMCFVVLAMLTIRQNYR